MPARWQAFARWHAVDGLPAPVARSKDEHGAGLRRLFPSEHVGDRAAIGCRDLVAEPGDGPIGGRGRRGEHRAVVAEDDRVPVAGQQLDQSAVEWVDPRVPPQAERVGAREPNGRGSVGTFEDPVLVPIQEGAVIVRCPRVGCLERDVGGEGGEPLAVGRAHEIGETTVLEEANGDEVAGRRPQFGPLVRRDAPFGTAAGRDEQVAGAANLERDPSCTDDNPGETVRRREIERRPRSPDHPASRWTTTW